MGKTPSIAVIAFSKIKSADVQATDQAGFIELCGLVIKSKHRKDSVNWYGEGGLSRYWKELGYRHVAERRF